MCIQKFNGKSWAAFSVLTCVVLFSATLVQAQTFSDVQKLEFYPVPLDTAATEPAAVTACSCPGTTGFSDVISGAKNIDAAVLHEGFHEGLHEGFDESAEPYAPEATQQRTNAGLLYQLQNRHDEAVSSLERAAASSRIHSGLYSPEQIFISEHTINSLVAMGRFDEAEEKYSQLVNINQKVYGPRASQTAHALLSLGQLQVDGLQRDGGYEADSSRSDALYQAQDHFVDAIRMLIDSEAWTDPAIFALEQNLIRTYYLDALRAGVINDPVLHASDNESRHSRMQTRTNLRSVPEQYVKGKQAYLRMIGYLKKDPNADIDGIADVMLGLADWSLLFGKQQEAQEQYRQLEHLMALAGTAPAEAAAILHPALPVTLPAFVDSALSPNAISETSGSRGYVDVSFNVNRLGHATNVDVLGTSDDVGSAVVDHLGKLVRNAQFRPGTDAGADFSLRYYFSY